MEYFINLFKMLGNNRGEVGVKDAPYVERDADEVAAEAYAELDAAEKGESQTPKESSTPKKDDDKGGEPADKSDEQVKDGEDGKPVDDKKEDADEKPTDEESGEADKQGEKSKDDKSEDEKVEDNDLDKKITEHAEKHKMTYAEAKDDIEKTEEIIKQYKNDPAEMARAMRAKDREFNKLRLDAEKLAAKKEPVFKRKSDDEFRAWAREKVKATPAAIENFRQKFPAKSENMSDEAIVEEVVEQGLAVYHEKAAEKEHEIRTAASKKRTELIDTIVEADRRFIPEVKALLLETDDESILSDGMDIQDALKWAKGSRYDADIKAAEERGFKRGKEQATIVGVKTGGTGGSKPAKTDKSVSLSKTQKTRALEMFGTDYSEEKAYQMFQETYADELKKNANFDPYAD
jgi:hypothetical protein